MDIAYVESIIGRAQESLQKSSDPAYREALARKIQDVESKICLDQVVTTLDELDASYEIIPCLEKYVKDLDMSIGNFIEHNLSYLPIPNRGWFFFDCFFSLNTYI